MVVLAIHVPTFYHFGRRFLSKDTSLLGPLEILIVTSSIVGLPMSCKRLKNEYVASALIITLLATVTLIPLNSENNFFSPIELSLQIFAHLAV